MIFLVLSLFVIICYIFCDLNYFLRTVFGFLCVKVNGIKVSLKDVTTIYGMCTFQDCDVTFTNVRLARIVRELDFARYDFYEKTGVYQRSQDLNITSLQGCTFTITMENVPMFMLYRIDTKLVYWDDCSLFLEHQLVTTSDGLVRMFLISRQHAIGQNGDSTEALLRGLPGANDRPKCPDYIEAWLRSMSVSSGKLRSIMDQ